MSGTNVKTIRYATADSSLGRLFLAMTDKGLCAVSFDGDAQVRCAELRARFPGAELRPDPAGLEATVRGLRHAVDAPGQEVALPTDTGGTVFQQRVWRALQAIPPGRTESYAGLARRIGRPGAARAVAGACAANPLAVLVPCHRVLRSDGALGGYRWGLERKRTLLAREASAAG
jgi:AraC family transcriptional regulator, regulatory protein of adaptative response / methylated-DNA-[protein]-cysteine methyltransferase